MGSYGITIGTNTITAPNLYTAWASLIPAMQARHIDLIRFQRRWKDIETSPGVYDWSVTDDIASHLNANGILWHFTIQGAPTWALLNPGMQSSQLPFYLMDPTLTAGFARALCNRYYPGSPFGHFDVLGCNEDFNSNFESPGVLGIHASRFTEYNATVAGASANVQPDRDPYFAAQVVASVAPIVRTLNPTVLLGLPVIWWRQHPNTLDFLQGLYDMWGSQLNSWFDFADMHFYSKANNPMQHGSGANYAPAFDQAWSDMQTTLTANGAASKSIWFTEFGWAVPTDVSAATQAANYQAVLASAARSGAGTPRIGRMILYTYDFMGSDASSLVQSDHVTYQPADAIVQQFTLNDASLVGSYGKFMAHA